MPQKPVSDYFIQIVNTHPNDGGQHWITLATSGNPLSSAVKIYDSGLTCRVSSSVEKSVANILKTVDPNITCRLMNNDLQPNSNDCGLYAIAFSVSIANGNDPVNLSFDNSRMRKHLLTCIQNEYMAEFPHSRVTRSTAFTQSIISLCIVHAECQIMDLCLNALHVNFGSIQDVRK